jgi:hypothetical protein
MTTTSPVRTERSYPPNRLAPLRFVRMFGLVSGLGNFVYEGAHSISIRPGLPTAQRVSSRAQSRLAKAPGSDFFRRSLAQASTPIPGLQQPNGSQLRADSVTLSGATAMIFARLQRLCGANIMRLGVV